MYPTKHGSDLRVGLVLTFVVEYGFLQCMLRATFVVGTVVLHLSLGGCAAPSPPEAPYPPPPVPGEDALDSFLARVDSMDCAGLREATGGLPGDLTNIGAYGARGQAVTPILRKALDCEEPWAGVLIFRYLPYLSERQYGATATREFFVVLGNSELRSSALASLKRWLAAGRWEISDGVSDESWWEDKSTVRVEEAVGLSCGELSEIEIGNDMSFRAVRALMNKQGCSVVPALVKALDLSSSARGLSCIELKAMHRGQLPSNIGNRVAEAIATDPGQVLCSSHDSLALGVLRVPVCADRTRRFAAREHCEDLAERLGGIYVQELVDNRRLTVHYFGAPVGFRLDIIDAADHAVASASIGQARPVPDSLDALSVELASRSVDEWGATGWHSLSSSTLDGTPGHRQLRFLLGNRALARGERIRLTATERDGRTVDVAYPSDVRQ